VPELLEILKSAKSELRLRGLTMHIGSQIFTLNVLKEALEKTIYVHKVFEKNGFKLDRLDIGGGLGVQYDTEDASSEMKMIADYGAMVVETITQLLGKTDTEILLEPGRILVARSGLLVGEVQYIKRAPAKTFAILDTGMHHLIRPALYGAKHRVLPLHVSGAATQLYDIVGPICESSDFLAKNVTLPTLSQGDLVAIADSGAYGMVMASHYNSHQLPHEIAVAGGKVIEA
jgi:diaminopimelate decarboxylase